MATPASGSSPLFAQHLGIARALLDQFQDIPKRMIEGLKEDEARGLAQEARTTWEGLWDQLQQARAIVVKLGRDVSAYDAARQQAGDIWLHAVDVHFGAWQSTIGGQKRTVTWMSAPLAPARAAIAALLAAMPETVVSDAAPADVELRSSYKWITNYGALVVIGVIVAIAVWKCH